jgi:hypothetical protein
MINRLMITTAAAALIAGSGFAYAQGNGMGREAPSSGSTVQQSAPSSGTSAAPANRDAAEPASPSQGKAAQSDQKSPAAGKSQRTEDMQGQKQKGMNSEKRAGSDDSAKDSAKDGKDMKAEGRDGNNAEGKSQTTGQAGAGGKLSTEQRTKITTVIREQHVQPASNVNFSISVGTRVPREVSFHPLPTEIVTIYPDWRGYEFFLVSGQIIVVNPRTLEIVAVLDA